MNRVPKYFKQNNSYTCSLAVLRMVLAFYGVEVSEVELIRKVEKDYGKKFKNLLNPTIAKLAREYGIKTTLYAAVPLSKKDELTKALSSVKKEMFKAIELGCECVYEKLTAAKIKSSLSKGYLVQTSIKLHEFYPEKRRAFHSILIYKVDGETVFYHDPKHGERLSCLMDTLIKASRNVRVAMIYSGLD